jgi:hypothetical protein
MTQKCVICLVTKPLTSEFFYRDSSKPLGFEYRCKICDKLRTRKRKRYPLTKQQKDARNVNRRNKPRKQYKSPYNRTKNLLKSYTYSDTKSGLVCDLSVEWLDNHILTKPCMYCNTTAEPRGCDRIDNTLGHLKTNVVPCCRTCNLTRGNRFTHSEMLIIGKTIKDIRKTREDK